MRPRAQALRHRPKPAEGMGGGHSAPARRLHGWPPATGAVVILVAVGTVYAPAFRADYVLFDDTDYIPQNPYVVSPDGLWRIWFARHDYPPNVPYYPLTFTTHWLEYRLWGSRPAGYHIVNVVLHAANTLLVWLLLRRLSVPGAFFAALWFAVHPLHVPSVAWLAERKNVLSVFFYLLALLAWLRFVRGPGWKWYAAALGCFVLGLLSKTIVCTLPAVLVLWIGWRGRATWRRTLPAVIPFAVVAMVFAYLTTLHEHGMLEGAELRFDLSLTQRLLLAGRAFWFYAQKLLWPAGLMPLYPRWNIDPRHGWEYVFPASAVGALVLAWWLRRESGAGLLVTLLFLGISLAPTLGLVDFGYMGHSFVADHFMYLPSIGPLAGVAALFNVVARYARPPVRSALFAMGILAALGLAGLARARSETYRNAITFWSAAAARNPGPTTYSALGEAYYLDRQYGRAEQLLRQALAEQDAVRTRFRLGCVLMDTERFGEAIEQFERGIARNEAHERIRGLTGWMYFNIATCWFSQGEFARAAEYFRRAREREPRLAPRCDEGLALCDAYGRESAAPGTSPAAAP